MVKKFKLNELISGECEIREVGGFLKYVCDIPPPNEYLRDNRTYYCVNSSQIYNVVHKHIGRSVML